MQQHNRLNTTGPRQIPSILFWTPPENWNYIQNSVRAKKIKQRLLSYCSLPNSFLNFVPYRNNTQDAKFKVHSVCGEQRSTFILILVVSKLIIFSHSFHSLYTRFPSWRLEQSVHFVIEFIGDVLGKICPGIGCPDALLRILHQDTRREENKKVERNEFNQLWTT